jgi:hypothetical protein
MADPKVATPVDPMAGVNSLLTTFGGTKTTTSPGSTAALESALAGLRGQDNTALLQSIFQQAQQAIPGLQASMGRAIGARSGNNSALAGALQKLLASTTVTAQDQLAKQQLANLQTQVQAGGQIAQATRGTTQTQGTDLGNAAKNLALLKLIQQSGLLEKLGFGDAAKTMTGGAMSSAGGGTGMAPAPQMGPTQQAPQAAPQAMTSAPDAATQLFQTMAAGAAPAVTSPVNQPGSVEGTMLPFVGDSNQMTVQPEQDYGVLPGLEQYLVPTTPVILPYPEEQIYGFADGGLVGRDGKVLKMEPSDTPEAEEQEDVDEALSNARFDAGFTANEFFDTFRKALGDSLGKPENYADGGLVTSSRQRGITPRTQLLPDTGRESKLTDEALTAMQTTSAPVASTTSALPVSSSNPLAMLNTLTSGDAGGQSEAAGFQPQGGRVDPTVGKALQTAALLNAASGVTGGPSIPGLGGVVGMINAPTAEAALNVGGQMVGNMIAPGLGSLAGAGISLANNNASGAANALLGLVNPFAAVASGISGALGGPTAGSLAFGSPQTISGSPISGGLVNEATMGLFGNLGLTPGGGQISGDTPAMSSPVAPQGDVVGTPLGSLGGDVSADGFGSGMAGGYDKANGGPISGPGTGTSDSIKANLSNGEYVMSADVVQKLGEDFFDLLQAAFHTPVAKPARA